MARHRSGKNNYALSTNVIVALVVIVALILGLVWWFWLRDTTQSQQAQQEDECLQGQLSLPVAAQSPAVAEELIAQWAATSPVVRDYCVSPELVADVGDAAVYVAAESPATTAVLEDAGRTPASSRSPVVAEETVGIASRGQVDAVDGLDPAEVVYPVADQADAAVAAAHALGGEEAAGLLARDREQHTGRAVAGEAAYIAVAEHEVPEGYEFTALPGTAVRHVAITLGPAGEVGEEHSRAGTEFASHAGERATVTTDGQQDLGGLWAVALGEAPVPEPTEEEQTGEEQPEPEAPVMAAPPTDTLLLLDTSRAMAADLPGAPNAFRASAEAFAGVATDLEANGNLVALWNYSSPINPGVTKGWRTNIGFSEGSRSAEAVRLFGTGGFPQTRSALIAAAEAAAYQAAMTGTPVRILLLTTGTDGDVDDATFAASFGAVATEGVWLDVVHLGDAPVDPVVADLADSLTRVSDADALNAGVRSAAGL